MIVYGNEYKFKGNVAEFVATVTTFSQLVTYRGTPGPYGPLDIFTRLIPNEEEFPTDITYAKFKFNSRFTRYTGLLIANSLPDGNTLLVVDIPTNTVYESEYSEKSIYWAWENLKEYLIRHGWIDKEGNQVKTINQYLNDDEIKDEKHQVVIQLSRKGLTVSQISSQTGYSDSHVKRLRAKYRKHDTNDTI